MSYPSDFTDEGEPEELEPPLKPYTPGKARGPATTLTEEMITTIATALGDGATKRDAATLAGTSDVCLHAWLARGRTKIAERKRSIYTRLVTEVDRAEAHYRMELVRKSHEAIDDRHMNDRVIRWRLALSAPKDFTLPREGGPGGAQLGPAFEMVTPEQAAAALEEKIELFLSQEAPPAPPTEAPPGGN